MESGARLRHRRSGNGRGDGSRKACEEGGITAEDEAIDARRASPGGERREGVTVAGGVTIEEMPPSPAAVAPLGRVDPNVSAVSSSSSRGGGTKQRTPAAAAVASCGRDDSAKESRGGSLSASSDDEAPSIRRSASALDVDVAATRRGERDSPKRTPPFVGGGEKDWSGGGSVSAARRRMIADRARRILEGDESD